MTPIFQVAACGTHRQSLHPEHLIMPSLVRFLTVIAIVAAAIYAGLYSLAHFVHPKPREISVTIPPDKFFKNR
jgi:hypothetical protein